MKIYIALIRDTYPTAKLEILIPKGLRLWINNKSPDEKYKLLKDLIEEMKTYQKDELEGGE